MTQKVSLGTRFQLAYNAIFGSVSPASSPNHWIFKHVSPKTAAGVPVSEWTALNLPSVYACVNRISNPLSMFPIEVRQRRGASRASDLVKEHPLNELLRWQPNSVMDARTLKKLKSTQRLLWGNSYVEVQRNGKGEAIALWPLMAWSTWAERNDETVTYQTTIDGQTFSIRQEDVLHVMDMTLDGITGLSQIQAARSAVGLGLAAERFGEKFFANDARSGGFLSHPGKLGDKGKKNVRQSFSGEGDPETGLRGQGGLDNAYRVKVLEEGMKYIPTTIPPDDAQFLSTRQFQLEEIARIYNVPLILLQSNEKDTSWGTGLEQTMIAFIVHTLQPWATADEMQMNLKLLTREERESGLFIKYNMNALLRGDMQSRREWYETGIQNGYILRSEVRELEDWEAVDGLDRPTLQQNMAVLDENGEQPSQSQSANNNDRVPGGNQDDDATEDDETDQDDEDEQAILEFKKAGSVDHLLRNWRQASAFLEQELNQVALSADDGEDDPAEDQDPDEDEDQDEPIEDDGDATEDDETEQEDEQEDEQK